MKQTRSWAALGMAALAWVWAMDVVAAVEARIYPSGDYAFSTGPVPAFVEPAELPDAWPADAPGYSGARWRVWLVDMQVDRRNGYRRSLDYAYEPVAPELLGEAARLQVDFSPEFETLTLHGVDLRRDGVWKSRLAPERITLARREAEFERDMANGTVTALLVLDDVRSGDVIRLRYTIDGANPIMAGLTSDSAGFGWVHPQLHGRLRVLFPPQTPLLEHRDAIAPQRSLVERADATIATYEAHRLDALRDEGSYPLWYNPVPRVWVASRRSWGEVARWAQTLYPAPAPLPDNLRARIDEWRRLPDPAARLAAALRAVQEEVRYFGVEIGDSTHRPAEPALTWERRFGDCKDKVRLLVAVLAALDIEAAPALVSASRGRGVEDTPPSAGVFDHVIARVQLDGSTLWLDPTMTQQRGAPQAMTVGDFGRALVVAPGTEGLTVVARPAGAADSIRVLEQFSPLQDDEVDLRVETAYVGEAAERQRRNLQVTGLDGMAQNYADHYRRRFGEVSVGTPVTVEDDEDGNRLTVREHYRLRSPWVAQTPGHRALELYSDAIAPETALPEVVQRRAPLPIAYPIEVQQVSRIAMPDGWRWVGSGETVRIADDMLRYESKSAVVDGTVQVTRNLVSLMDVAPVASLDAHFKLRRRINEDLGERIVLAVPARAATREREQRLNSLMRGLMDRDRNEGGKR